MARSRWGTSGSPSPDTPTSLPRSAPSRVEETFSGVITSLTGYGFYVELEECLVEGLVPISSLRDDEYRFSADRGEWVGVVRKRGFSLGERLRLRRRKADVDRGELDFAIVDTGARSPLRRSGRGFLACTKK